MNNFEVFFNNVNIQQYKKAVNKPTYPIKQHIDKKLLFLLFQIRFLSQKKCVHCCIENRNGFKDL